MKNKPKDKEYCGVSLEKIQNAEPILNKKQLRLFYKFLRERYKIHIKKDVLHQLPPFTKDPILKEFKFTNIRREHDRETKWVIKYITNNEFLTYRQKMLNCILFRMFNKHETMEIMGAPFQFEGIWHITDAKRRLANYAESHPEYPFFTNAFITSGMKRALNEIFPKESFVPATVLRFCKRINENGFMRELMICKTQEEVYNKLKKLKGIGEFLAYQIFVDFTYIRDFPFSENEFTVAGPGCRKGLDYLFEDKDGMSYEECLFWLRNNWNNIPISYGLSNWFDPKKEMIDLKHYDRVMNVMSLENCFCEFSKYYKVCNEIGRPRNKYKFDGKKELI